MRHVIRARQPEAYFHSPLSDIKSDSPARAGLNALRNDDDAAPQLHAFPEGIAYSFRFQAIADVPVQEGMNETEYV